MTTSDETGPTREEVEAMFARRQLAYQRLDAGALAADYAENATVGSPFAGNPQGPVKAEEGLQKIFDTFRELSVHTSDPIIDGTQVAQMVTATATGINEIMGLPASNHAIPFKVVMMYELQGLRIVHEERIYDSTGIWVQMGVLKVKPV